ncbi:MAG: phosphoenolpyruvate synthase [Nanoarchaeota archaeon]|nr:phosphoenolpyruvate synthase [Nanoarchaeota archaeon]
MDKRTAFILWFDQLGIEDVPLVGGKNASLGEMYRMLTPKGVKIPNGFAVTAYAYAYLLEHAGIKDKIRDVLKDLNTSDMENLAERGHKVRQLIRSAEFPPELKSQILAAYRDLCGSYNRDRRDVDVAVRSSATAEDLPDASFAGQQETYLNIKGDQQIIDACKKCFASLFTNRAISYRVDKGFDHFSIGLSIGIQKMVRSDLASSGVMFSIDTESGFKEAVLVTSAYGLGENVVQGAVNPDEYYVFKTTLKMGFKPIITKKVGEKSLRMIYDVQGSKGTTKNVSVPEDERRHFALNDEEVLTLARWACIIEDHYSAKAGHFKPMDMEWAKDGQSGQLFIVQARPETVVSKKDLTKIEEYTLKEKGKVLAVGRSVGQKIGQGTAHVIRSVKDIGLFRKGEVLVTEMTDPDWEPIMKIASAIVTNRGGRTCHAAIISRELGIPCIVGTNDGTQTIKDGELVTVSCAEGDEGHVYQGQMKYDVKRTDLSTLPQLKTQIMMNVGNPEEAFELSFLPNEGVGLAREEFIINSYIKAHPIALIEYAKQSPEIKKQIDEISFGYDDKTLFFIDKLAQGVATIAAAFYPKKVILRFSDFKTNEYANLLGGQAYEPKEENPMIGWRGASRYYKDGYKAGFGLECKAIKKVRDEMGLTNLELMIPICRTVSEGRKVLAEMEKYGLKRGENGLKVNVMCEVPSNCILADQFLQIFDGFSIGSNDLTQFTLACDRDSQLVADIYDERNDAVKTLIRQAIQTANRMNKYIGICGQAPSDYPEFAQFLVEAGIHSLSLNPDSIVRTRLAIAETEKKLFR